MAETLSTAPKVEQEPPSRPPAMRPLELARWTWRQLTSMRAALILLFLLTLAAVPGSIVPQEGVNPVRVARFRADHPDLAPWYDRLSLFHVYSAPWFAAIYLLLFVSLAGCVVPRAFAHATALRARPPVAPRNLDRLPAHESWRSEQGASEIVEQAARLLRRRRYRVDVHGTSVSAETGYLREVGNLVFHASLILLLAAVAVGNLYGYKGNVLVVEGQGFSNTVSAYDTFKHGSRFDQGSLAPFWVRLDRFSVRYQETGDQRGAPRDFQASLTYGSGPGSRARHYDLRVNHPLVVDGTKVFLIGNGYAPVFTVRDGTGHVVFSGPVPFLPRDGMDTSTGVVKVPSARPHQLGFQGVFLPTAFPDPREGWVSVFPDTRAPRAVLTAWVGNLGLDNGVPQSVYELDTSHLRQVRGAKGQPLSRVLAAGQQMTLPQGQGSIRFDGVRRYVTLQVAKDPGKTPATVAAVLALAGLMASLFVRRRRVWVRAGRDGEGRTLVEVAGLARTEGDAIRAEVEAVSAEVRGELRTRAGQRTGRSGHEED